MGQDWLQINIEQELDWWEENAYSIDTDPDPVCEKCGSPMDLVKLPTGAKFFGCVLYPKCRSTASLDKG